MARGGCQWRLLPFSYGHWGAVHKPFKYWAQKGIWSNLLHHVQVDPDVEYTMIDGTIVGAHACAAGYIKDGHDQEALGRSKGGLTTKIHALVDGLGNPLKFILTDGQRNEMTQGEKLTESITNTILIADKGYDSNAFFNIWKAKGVHQLFPQEATVKTRENMTNTFIKNEV